MSWVQGRSLSEFEPQRRVSEGFYGVALPGLCLAGRIGVRTGGVVIVGATLQKQMCGGGVVGGGTS